MTLRLEEPGARAGRHVCTHAVRVGYIDTDKANVVHHGSYLAWLEAARIEYWRERGFVYRDFELDTGMAMPVVELNVRYRTPARFDDALTVRTWVTACGRAKVVFEQRITRGETVMVDARTEICCVHLEEGRVCSVPEAVQRASR